MIDLADGLVATPLIRLSSGPYKVNINEGFEGDSLEIHLLGCNLHCDFCSQEYLSRVDVPKPEGKGWRRIDPEEVVLNAVQGGVQTIVISGGEPTIHPKYVSEIGREARSYSLKTRVLTNGFISISTLEKIVENIDSMVIGIKGSLNHSVYTQMRPAIVLETMKRVNESRVQLAISNLVDPSFNDSTDDICRLSKWIMENLNPMVPMLLCFRTLAKFSLLEFVGEKQGTPFWHDKNGIRDWVVQRATKAKECGLQNLMYLDPTDKQLSKKI